MRIEVNDLHHEYPGGVKAIQGISLNLEQGELVGIVGQNGAGKTTLVKHLNGLLKPTQGTVNVGDWDTRNHPVSKLAQRVGYVFQNPDEQLFCKTVHQEIAFGPQNLGFTSEKIQALVSYVLDLCELEKDKDTNPYDLSPTWRKMVALASVIAMDTPVVILDEPTTGQDAANVGRIARIVAALHQQGKTVITISHDIDFCAENFERIIALAQGKVLLDGPVHEVIAQEELLATTYVDPPQLTRLGKRLGLGKIVRNQSEFLEALREKLGNE